MASVCISAYHQLMISEYNIFFDSIEEAPSKLMKPLLIFSGVNMGTEAQRQNKLHMFRVGPVYVGDS